jgi:hypothetical protein
MGGSANFQKKNGTYEEWEMERNINIWDDPWIPSLQSRRIATRRGNIILTKVSELIDFENRSWDERLIRITFWRIDAERILKIPLALGMMEDFIS